MSFFLSFLRINIYVICISFMFNTMVARANTNSNTVFSDYLRAYFSNINHDTAYAQKIFSHLLKTHKNNPMIYNSALKNAIELGNFDIAEKIANPLFITQKNHSLARFVLGVQSLKKADYKSARLYFLAHSSKKIFILLDNLIQAWTYFAERKEKKAVHTLKSMVKKHKELRFFYNYHYALMSDLMQQKNNAHTLYSRSYKIAQGDGRLVDAYGRHLLRKNYFTKAKDIYKKQLEQRNNIFLNQSLTWAEKRIKPAFIVRNAKEGMAESFFSIALNLIYNGENRVAHVYLKAALELRPDLQQATILLAEIYQGLGLCQRAIEYYKKIPRSSIAYIQSQLQIADCLIQEEQPEKAKKKLHYLLAIYPNNIDLLRGLGNLYRIEKDYNKAQDIYHKILENSPADTQHSWKIYYHLGIVYERTKQWNIAEKYFLKALKLDDKQPSLLNYLGYSWIDQKKNLKKGLHFIQKALKIRPNDGYILDSLGWAHYQLNNFEEAVVELEKAIRIVPSDPVINDHLGDAFWKIGRKKEALYQWYRALKMEPEKDTISLIKEKIHNALEKGV